MRTIALFSLASITTAAFVAACGGSEPAPSAPPVASVVAVAAPASTAPPAGPSLALAQTGIETTWMDPSADPCQDYFAYACGGFVRNTPIPADRATWDVSAIIQKTNEEFLRGTLETAAASPGADPVVRKIGDYYAACTDEAAIDKAGAKPIAPLMATVGKVRDSKTLAEAITALHAQSIFPLFDVSSQQDFKDATQMIAGLDQDGLGLPDRDYYLKDDGNLKEVREFYVGHVARMFALAGLKPAESKTAVDDVMRIETKIAKLEQDKVTRRDPYRVYHRIDRAGLLGVAKTFPWEAYFKGLGIPEVQAISVNEPAYFTGIDALMHEERPAAWRHYLAWHVLHSEARKLSKPFVEEAFALRQKLTGQKELEPRWKRCVRCSRSRMWRRSSRATRSNGHRRWWTPFTRRWGSSFRRYRGWTTRRARRPSRSSRRSTARLGTRTTGVSTTSTSRAPATQPTRWRRIASSFTGS
jgi:putative endopeptidase